MPRGQARKYNTPQITNIDHLILTGSCSSCINTSQLAKTKFNKCFKDLFGLFQFQTLTAWLYRIIMYFLLQSLKAQGTTCPISSYYKMVQGTPSTLFVVRDPPRCFRILAEVDSQNFLTNCKTKTPSIFQFCLLLVLL